MTRPQAKIASLTLNPAIDETITLARLQPGKVMRAQAVRFNAGGKGVNVASCLAAAGFAVTATGILGRENSIFFRSFFSQRGIDDRFLYIDGATRTNIKLVAPDETTDINVPGLEVTGGSLDKIRRLLADMASDVLVLAGSLPPGCPDDFYAGIIAGQQPGKTRIIVDCSGKPLEALMKSKLRPFCLKPNRDELSQWAGKPLETLRSILAEARRLHKAGVALVVVSMGQDGALFVSEHGAVHACIKLERVESTVGAGDAMVAGIAAALTRGLPLRDIAQNATAWAAGKLECFGASLPPPERLAELAGKAQCTFLE